MKNSLERLLWGCLFGFFVMFITGGCGKTTSNLPYRLDTDMMYLNGSIMTINQAQVVADYMWDTVSKQYGNEVNDTFLSQTCFADSDITLEQYEKEYVLYREIMLLNCFSQMYEKEGKLSETEQDEIRRQAEAYYEACYAGKGTISKEDCIYVYTLYGQARKYQSQLHQSINLAISDEQVRVVTCGIVKLQNEPQGEWFLQELSEGENFFDLAKEDGVNRLAETVYNVTREDERFPEAVIAKIYDLEEGQVSPVIFAEGAYYVVTVTDLYHDTLSAQHREQLVAEYTNAYYEEICSAYLEQSEIYFNHEAWETLAFPAK